MFSLTVYLIRKMSLLNEICFKHTNRQKFQFFTVVFKRTFSAGAEETKAGTNTADLISSEKYEIKKSVKVAFIGYPNVGKSTLINALTGLKICAASKKPHTTRKTQKAFILRGDTEMIILDTPGVVSERERNRFSLDDSFNLTNSKELETADLIGLVCDSSNPFLSRLNKELRNLLLTLPCRSDLILIFNKIDIIKDKRRLLTLTQHLLDQGLVVSNSDSKDNKKIVPQFSQVFMISALKNDGIEDIAKYICSRSNVSHKNVSSKRITNHKDEEVIANRVKAALLEHLAYEIPYKTSCEVEFLNENVSGELNAVVLIKYPRENYRKIIEGKGNRRINMIKNECEKDLTELFGKPFVLKLVTVFPKSAKNIR